MNNLFLSDRQVAARYSTSRPTIWRWVKAGSFPPPVKLSPGCTRWPVDRILEWEKNLQATEGPKLN